MEIVLDNIGKRFGETLALDGVSLKIKDGELMAILGPSGCGKTTLLRIVAGLLEPDEGKVLFDGRDVTAHPPEKRNVGMVFQNYALFPHRDVASNIAFGLRMRKKGGKTVKKRVEDVLTLVGLEGYGKRMPSELSGGEQQRVALARAIAPEPDILLLDEPLSALDAKLRISLRSEIRRIQKELGITAVYVTHDREEAMAISDTMAVMRKGRVEQVGAPLDIYRNPVNSFVASFLGDANLIPVLAKGGHAETPFGRVETDISGRALLFFRPGDCFISDDGIEARIVSTDLSGDILKLVVRLENEKIVLLENISYTEKMPETADNTVKISVNRKALRVMKR